MATLMFDRGKLMILSGLGRIGLVIFRQGWHPSAQQKPEAALWKTK
jgi:hypothetical protein